MSDIPTELIKKIRQIEISTSRKAQDIFAGEYQSTFKGKGMDFEEVREYQEGDDVRHIDWNVSARMDHPHIKVFKEERELTVNLVVDLSSSGEIGSGLRSKREMAAEIAAVLAFAAIKNNDRVGLVLYSDHVEKHIAPGKGQRHVLRVVRDILFHKPQGRKTDTSGALRYLNQVTPRTSILFLISDFLEENIERSLKVTARKHDVIAVHVRDPIEERLPAVGWITLEDAETGNLIEFNSSNARYRASYEQSFSEHMQRIRNFFKRIDIDLIEVKTDQPYERELEYFFKRRNDRRRRG